MDSFKDFCVFMGGLGAGYWLVSLFTGEGFAAAIGGVVASIIAVAIYKA